MDNFALPATLYYLVRCSAAYLIDVFVLFAGVLVTHGIIYTLGLNPFADRMTAGESLASWQLHLWVFATVSVPCWIYYASLHSSTWQATLGKRLMGLRVTITTGERLGLARALLRAVVMLIPFEWNHVVLFQLASLDGSTPSPLFWASYAFTWLLIVVYFGVMLFDPRRRSVHDWVVGTQVEHGARVVRASK